MKKKHTDINYGNSQVNLMNNVMKTVVQQSDYKGMGGHGLATHGNHGLHTQKNIGLTDTTLNFRNIK